MNKKNIAIASLSTTTALTGLTFALGGVISELTLSKKNVCNTPEDLLDCNGMRDCYNKYPHYREADDWYVAKNPEAKTILNRKGEKLHYYEIKAENLSHKYAICIHGYTSKPRRMSGQGKHYYDMGFNTIFPVMAAHRTDDRSHCSMGYFEKFDVVDLINHIVSVDSEAEILIHGCSMGAATTMGVIGEKLPSNVKVAVEDCGYTSVWEQFRKSISEAKHLPAFPFLYSANAYSKLFLGWDFKKCSPLEAVSRSVTPTVFIHGDNDELVPFSMLQRLYDACPAPKVKKEIPGAGHDMSLFMHPDIYWEAVDNFIKDYI